MSVPPTSHPDPVRQRRRRVARATRSAKRVGYLLLVGAMVVFVVGFAVGFTGTLVAVVTAALAIASVLLAPAIVLGYAVNAAERDDRQHRR